MLPPQLLLSLPDSLASGFLQATRAFPLGSIQLLLVHTNRGLWQDSNDQMPSADELYVQRCMKRQVYWLVLGFIKSW